MCCIELASALYQFSEIDVHRYVVEASALTNSSRLLRLRTYRTFMRGRGYASGRKGKADEKNENKPGQVD